MNAANMLAALSQSLTQAEKCVSVVSQALIQGQADMVESATRELHDSVHALALVLRPLAPLSMLAPQTRDRLDAVAQAIAMQREALLRRSAAIDRSVLSLVPQTRTNTYAQALGRYARAPTRAGAFGGAF